MQPQRWPHLPAPAKTRCQMNDQGTHAPPAVFSTKNFQEGSFHPLRLTTLKSGYQHEGPWLYLPARPLLGRDFASPATSSVNHSRDDLTARVSGIQSKGNSWKMKMNAAAVFRNWWLSFRKLVTPLICSRLGQDFVAPFCQQSCQDLRIVGGIYWVATQSGKKRRFKPKRSGRVGKNLINARQVACSRAVAHPRLLTPLRSQLHRRLISARRLQQERWDYQSGPGQSA